MTAHDPTDDDTDLPAACRPTADRLNRALDGDGSLSAVAADPHAVACPACRERVRLAALVFDALSDGTPVVLPFGFAERTVKAVLADRSRRRFTGYVGAGLATAAAVLVAVFTAPRRAPEVVESGPPTTHTITTEPTPPVNPPATDDLVKAGEVLRELTRRTAETTAAAPRAFAPLVDVIDVPAVSPMELLTADIDAVGRTLGEIHGTAAAGFEPVADGTLRAVTHVYEQLASGGVKTGS